MRYIAAASILLIGLGIGFFIGQYTAEFNSGESDTENDYITETITDTIIKTKTVKVEVPVTETENTDTSQVDTVQYNSDSLDTELVEVEDTTYEDLSIRTEKLIGSKWLKVNVVEETEDKDTLIKEMLGIHNKLPSKLLVEFWQSPLNFSGYKLSRSKLILYDMPVELDYSLYRNKENYYLRAQTVYYSLKETEEFLPYKEVNKEVVFND